ncbi:MAG: hypothetical protein M9936_26800 [Caldilinea sp.]|nr:hypothetical protein [Caldilinea sp.]MCO5213328.1 hypothetical protein [Caldilinea sp.]
MESAQRSLVDGILLIGDNRFLLRLVATNLAPLTAAAILLGADSCATPFEPDTFGSDPPCKLILLALSRSSNEPVVVLAQAGLTQLVGRVPLLIISDRTFQADPERHIFHLPFPFSAQALRQQVADLLAPLELARLSTKEG